MSFFLAALSGLALVSAALDAESQGAFLHLPLSRRPTFQPALDDGEAHYLRRRADSVEVPLLNNRTSYAIDFELGTPPQRLSLDLYTSFSDVFIFEGGACARIAKCSSSSAFFDDESSSFHSNASYFGGAGYRDGQWAQDTIRLGGHNITNFNFGLVNRSSTGGVFGLGLATNEESFQDDDISEPYANLPLQLKQQGIIQQAAYSLWLSNEASGNAGSVLFGAVDHAKYATDLYVLPLVKTDEEDSAVTQFAVQLTGLSVFDADGNEQSFAKCDLPAVLEPSIPISAVPIDVIRPFYETLDVLEYDWDVYLVPCSALSSKDGGIGIHLGGVDVTVGFSDLFVKANTTDQNGTEYCVPGFLLTEDLPAIIGDNILKTLYVVYDLENLEVGIAAAQTGDSASSSSIEALSTGIPGTRVGKASNGTVSNLATEQITLITPSVSHATEVAISTGLVTISSGLESLAGLSTWGYTYIPWTAPSSESIVIGAKAGAQSTKAVATTATASGTSPTGISRGPSSASSKAAAVAGSEGSVTSSKSNSGDDRQPTKSSGASSSPASQSSRPSSVSSGNAVSPQQTTTAGAPVSSGISFLTLVAGLILSLL